MRIRIFLGLLFVGLVGIILVIVSNHGLYEKDLKNALDTNTFSLAESVSLEPNRLAEENALTTALTIDSLTKGTASIPKPKSSVVPGKSSDLGKKSLTEPLPNKFAPDVPLQENFNESAPLPAEIIVPEVSSTLPPLSVFPIDVNTASLEMLQNITGVGSVIAERIIEDRIANGPFYTIFDIMRVNGIGEATFQKMITQITVGNVTLPVPIETPGLPPPLPPPSSPPTPESIPGPVLPAETPPTPAKININTAGLEELQEITGVGPVISQRIIDYRTQNGPFQKTEDIKNVKGIGDATFEKMKDQITI